MPRKTKGKTKKEKKEKPSKSEGILAEAVANASLWEARLTAVEKLKQEYKENARKLLMENHALQTKMQQTEWETVDVVTFLKKETADRDAKTELLHKQVTALKVAQLEKIETLTFSFHRRINDVEDKLNAKIREADIYQNELKLVQEFRKKRLEMENDIQELKDAAEKTIVLHQKDLARYEKKSLEEKYQLQQESSQKIAELAEKAHQEAIFNLNDTTKLVYKENIRLTEALKYHMEDAVALQKEREIYVKEKDNMNAMLTDQKLLLHKKMVESKKIRTLNSKFSMKIDILEKSLHHMMNQFENQREVCMKETCEEIEVYKLENERLKQIIEVKTKEMNKVRRLARNILEQRTELETFFIEGIDYVKNQIMHNQGNYIYEAKLAYQQKILEANLGRTPFPKVRTFNKAGNSTNDVCDDFETAAIFSGIDKDIAISDLTWEQKERVLRYMFAKMNGYSSKGSPPPTTLALLPAINSKKLLHLTDLTLQSSSETFLTQAKLARDTFPEPDLIFAS